MTLCVDERGALWVTEAHTYRWGTNGSPFQPPTNPINIDPWGHVWHISNGEGSPNLYVHVIPGLARLGAATTPAYLIESILEPSRVIKTGYQTETIETHDGRDWTGWVESTSTGLILHTGPGDRVTVPASQIKRRTARPLSPMPEGLAAAMTDAELADLVAFLLTL